MRKKNTGTQIYVHIYVYISKTIEIWLLQVTTVTTTTTTTTMDDFVKMSMCRFFFLLVVALLFSLQQGRNETWHLLCIHKIYILSYITAICLCECCIYIFWLLFVWWQWCSTIRLLQLWWIHTLTYASHHKWVMQNAEHTLALTSNGWTFSILSFHFKRPNIYSE